MYSARARDVAAMHDIKVAEGSTPGEVATEILEIVGTNLKTVEA